jgi:hypothetical protein
VDKVSASPFGQILARLRRRRSLEYLQYSALRTSLQPGRIRSEWLGPTLSTGCYTMRTMRRFGICLLVVWLAAGVVHAAEAEFGPLERGALDAALAARGLAIDPAPQGKTVANIHVVNLDPFQPNDGGLLVWFNHFHRTTREWHIRRELLLQPGMRYDPLLVDETMRNLRNQTPYDLDDPQVTGIVAMVAVQTATPGSVDLLIVTRDVWSLRLNTDYNYEPGYLINFSASMSEHDLFGWRKYVALDYRLEPGNMTLGPSYFDPNLLGTRLRLLAAFNLVWERKIGEVAAGPREGSGSRLRIEYPFYALANRWGGFVDASNISNVSRTISGKQLTWFNPAVSECRIPPSEEGVAGADPNAACVYRLHTASIKSGITRAIPRPWLIQRFTFGNEFDLHRPSFLANFPEELRASFAARYFGPSDRTSLLYLQYEAFTPRYRSYRNLDTFDLGEDNRLGPWLTLKLGRASTLLGSERDFYAFLTELRINLALGGGFQSLDASWEGRAYTEGWRDQLVKANLYAATPILARAIRIVAHGELAYMADNIHRAEDVVGLIQGLRGYQVNAFFGYDHYVAQLEVRSLPIAVKSLRLGGLMFADAGHAAKTWQALQFYGDAGVGLRLLIPQLGSEVLRCDWAFPFRSYETKNGTINAGWPGRLSCGYHQVF